MFGWPLTAIGGSQPIGSLVATWGDDEGTSRPIREEYVESANPKYAKDVTALRSSTLTSVDVDLFGLKKKAGGDEESSSSRRLKEEGNEEVAKVDKYTGGFLMT